MLAPFGPFSDVDKVVGNDLAKLAAPCLLEKSGLLSVQKPSKPVDAFIRPPNDDGLIHEGSHVILFATRDNVETLIVKKGTMHDCKHGHFAHNEMIGKPFGTRVRYFELYSKKQPLGWVTLLRPTAELWTVGCSHRTEILYLSDISMIVSNLGVKPGSLVIETGTGTGSLSTAFITALQPSGRLYTFEYHDARATGAAGDFDRNGLSPWVTVVHRDTIKNGFPQELDGKVDAVFLDLPAPWDVVPAAHRALKNAAPFCSFSPCIEQIQRTAAALTDHGFVNIEMIECLQKAYDVRRLPIEEDNQKWDIDIPGQASFVGLNLKKRTRSDMELQNDKGKPQSDTKTSEESEHSTSFVAASSSDTSSSTAVKKRALKLPMRQASGDGKSTFISRSSFTEENSRPVSRPFPTMRGHTGYLIFARNYTIPRKQAVTMDLDQQAEPSSTTEQQQN